MRGYRRLLAALGLCLLALRLSPALAQDGAGEERLMKAVFIFNFAMLTSWPPNIWEKPDAPLDLCTLGSDEVASELPQLGGRVVKGHVIVVKEIAQGGGGTGCHLLYVAASQSHRYRHTLEELHGKPVLTVSQIAGFGRSGGMIELYRQQEKIRFLINIASARDAGLELSSRLLGLAEVIGMEPPQ